MAPVMPGNESVQATATAPGVTPCRPATGRRALARARLADRAGSAKSGWLARQSPAGRLAARWGGERAGEQAGGHRAVDDHPGLVLACPEQHVIGGIAVDQVERRLDGVHVADLLGRLQLEDAVVGQSCRGSCRRALRSVKTCQYSSTGVPSCAGQCIWYRSIRSTFRRRSEASTSARKLAGSPTRRGSAARSAGFQTWPPLVKM